VIGKDAGVPARRGARWRFGPGAALAALALGAVVPARAAEFPLPEGAAAVGAVATATVGAGDTLLDIARQFDLGYAEIVAANPGVDPWLPPVGGRIVLPMRFLLPDAPRRGIVVNLAERRLFYFPPHGGTVETYPIGVAVDGLDSPLGATRVVAKVTDPAWYPPPSILAQEPGLPRVVPPGPDNPLGRFALRLGWPNYLIHGTDKPDGVGRNVSHGCLHLYPEDIARLYREVPVGTRVEVVRQEVLAAWSGGALFVEAYPDKQQVDAIDTGEPMPLRMPSDLVARVTSAAGDAERRLDWSAVARAGRERSGLPVEIIPAALTASASE
jgi:L,D-transpeptidase ErfK/SrfK